MRCSGKVVDIKRGKIPMTNIMVIECEDGKKIEMLIHEDLITFAKGNPCVVEVTKELPEYKFGQDFCGRGVLVRDDGDKKLFSIGGYPFILYSNDKFEEGKYYICVKHP